jgi:hypothetical protein
MAAYGRSLAARTWANAAGAAAMMLAMAAVAAAPAAHAAAPGGGGGETIDCEPGQTANTDLGTCQDPLCGIGTERDPTGQTRYCVTIPCGPGQFLLPNSNQCISWPPPPARCPGGSVGVVHRLSTGVTVISCPRLPHGPPNTTVSHAPITGGTGANHAPN